jgi:hypothetical protein
MPNVKICARLLVTRMPQQPLIDVCSGRRETKLALLDHPDTYSISCFVDEGLAPWVSIFETLYSQSCEIT